MAPRCGWLLWLSLVLVTTDITYSAAPSCKVGCIGQNNNVLKYKEGTTYVYNLEGKTVTSVPKSKSAHGEATKLGIRAKAEVSFQGQCATLIQLKNVVVTGPDGKDHSGLSKLEANPLKVSFNGGSLSSQICTVPEDDYTSLNIKRAVASLLQLNSAESTTIPQETDVFGSCPTTYDVRQEADYTVIRKNRDLNQCSYRENIRQEIFSIPSSGHSELQSTPLLDPTYEATIRVKEGVINSAIAEETYLLRPFADGQNGAKTKITTVLTLESSTGTPIADKTKEPRSIIFENPHEVVSTNIQNVLTALRKVAENPVGVDAAQNVAELVAIIRRASAEDLLSVYGQVKAGAGFKNKALARKVFTDALFRSGSGDSVAVAVELLKSREITGNDAKLWYLSFAFARHASAAALEKATSLLADSTLPKEAYLGIGAFAGKYCREHLCENVPQFEALLQKLAAPLANPVPASRSDENKLVGTLKVLRNVRHLTDEVAGKVAAVIKDQKTTARVRVAALETAAADACRNKLQKAASDVLNNREEDAELRIKAYLVLVECPNAKTANKLSEFIEAETVNQVGAFITAHLRNLRATAKPDRQAARALLQNVKPRRQFPFDIRKFSQNYEISYDIDALGASASVDSNVIFSQKSYVPRSANLNLTAEFFGHSFNLFELSGRGENLERIVEKFLGPKGYLQRTEPKDIYSEGQSKVKSYKERIQERYNTLTRSRRSATKADIDNLAKKVKLSHSELEDNIDLDISLRLLGNELVWVNLAEKAPASPEEVIDKVAEALGSTFKGAKNFDHLIQNHAVFLDSELAYPTSSGLPLKLSATGTSVVHLKLGGNLDLKAFAKDPKNGELKVNVQPSASVEIVGQLSIDGYAVEAGVKLAGTLHTATGTEISLKLLDGEGFDLHVGLPVKKSDVLTVSTEVVSVSRERGQIQTNSPLEFAVAHKSYQPCFDQLLPIIGLSFCGSVAFPSDVTPLQTGAALYPLNGNSKVSLHVDKEDESLKNYHIRFQYSLKNPVNRRIELLLATPGSKTPREISFLAEAKTEPNKEVNLKLVTPVYNFRAQGLITDNDQEYSLSGLAEVENAFSYKARLGVLINGATYTPILEYTPLDGSGTKPVNVEGTVTVEKADSKRTYKFNNVRVVTAQGHVSVDGTISKDNNLFAVDLKLADGKKSSNIKFKVQRSPKNNLKLNLEVAPSEHPDFGFNVKYEYQRDEKHLENSLAITHGPDLTSKKYRLSIYQQINYDIESGYRFDVSTKNSLSYPLFGIEGKLDGAATQKSVHYDLSLAYEKSKIASKLNAKTGVEKPGDYEVTLTASALENSITVEAKRSIVAPNKSKFKNSIVINPGGTYSLDADVTHQLDKNNIDTELNAVAKIEGAAQPYSVLLGLTLNPSNVGAKSKISVGSSDLIDAEIKQKRTEPISGSFRLNIKKVIESNGQYKKGENTANGEVNINIVPINRKIKGTADLKVTGPKHAGNIEILYDAEKDPSKKISIQTDTDLSARSINSKNKIHVAGKDVLIDFNGAANGKPGNGGVSGGYDITLPNGLHLVARGKQALQVVPGNSNGELFLELGYSPEKGTPLSKLTIDTSARNVDTRRYSFDTKFEVSSICGAGEIYYKQSVKSVPHDGKLVIDAQNSFGGSRLGELQYNGKAKASISKAETTYHVSGALGKKYSADVQGKIQSVEEGKSCGVEQTLTVNTPIESLKQIKATSLVKYAKGDDTHPRQLKADFELNLSGNNQAPNNYGLHLKHTHEKDIHKSEVTVQAGRETKSVDVTLKADYTSNLALLNLQLTGVTPVESAKKFNAQLNYKKVSTVAGNAEVKVQVNDEKSDASLKWDLTHNRPIVDVNVNAADKQYRFFIKGDRKSARNGEGSGQVVWDKANGGVYDWSYSYDLENVEDFLVVIKLNCEKLKINKVKVEVGNRPSKGGATKKVSLSAVDKDGKIFSGTASYAIKKGETGYTIDGKGTVAYGTESYPLVYSFDDKILSKNANNEVGRQWSVKIDFEKGRFTQDAKYTDKETRVVQDVCWNKKCHHGEYVAKLEIEGLTKGEAEFTYINKNELEFWPKWSVVLSHKGKRDGLLLNTVSTASYNNAKYTVNTHVKATDAAIVVVVPTRELALIAEYSLPDRKKNDIVAKADASLYLDRKNNPKDKATLSLEASITKPKEDTVAVASAKFSHPSLQRELVVKAESTITPNKKITAGLELDVLQKKSQKVSMRVEALQADVSNGKNFTASANFVSKGLVLDVGASSHAYGGRDGGSVGAFAYYIDAKNVKREVGVYLAGSPKNLAVNVVVPGHTLIDGRATINAGTDVKSIEGELAIAESEPTVVKATLTGLQELKASLSSKNQKRSLNGLLSLKNEKLEASLNRVVDGKTDKLASGVIHLDQAKLFKVDYDIQSEQIKDVVKHLQQRVTDVLEKLRKIGESLSKELNEELTNLAEALKKAQPNFKALIEKYESVFKAIREELAKDPVYAELSAALKKSFGSILDVIESKIKVILEIYEKISADVVQIQASLVETYKKLAPDFIDTYKKLLADATETAKKLIDIWSKVFQKLLDVIRENEKDIKIIVNNLSESFQDIGKVTIQSLNQLRNEIIDFYKLIIEEIKRLPIYENAKDRLKELLNFELPPHFFELYSELVQTVDAFLPSPETKELAQTIFNYVEKRLKRQPVDDAQELAKIVRQLTAVVEELIKELKDYLKLHGLETKSISALGLNIPLPVPATAILRLPEFGNIRFSPLSLLQSINDLPSPLQFLYTYRPTLNPLDSIPPFKAYGIILNSHHFFTFDKKHLTFEESCSYVLAQDFKDGNFSIVANLEKGKLKSLTIADKHDVIELLTDNTIILNGKPGDLPVNTDEISGWRRYSSVNVRLNAGVHVTHYLAQDIYVIRVSGFYFGRTRGLLGTINNEQYDEFTLPNGHLAKDSDELGNAYKLSECPAVSGHKHSHNNVPECTNFFTSDSPLRNYFGIVAPEPYREACDHHAGMTGGQAKKAACEVAAAYVTALRQEGVLLPAIPPECAQCTVGGKKLELGQTEQINSPSGKADVVLVVEQSTHNQQVFKDLVTPLINKLTGDLKGRGISDVEYSLIGYGGPNQKWPQHYGSKGKITYDGKGNNLNFGDSERLTPPYDTLLKQVKFVKRYIDTELGREQIVVAMNEANKYPFRQGASKIIILINSTPCSTSPTFPLSLQIPRTLAIYRYYVEHGLNFYIVSPLAGLEQEKDKSKAKSIVGFDSEKVYYLANKDGVAEDRSSLHYTSDLCLAFSQFYGGAAFSSQNFIDSAQKSQFVEIVSQRIAAGATKYTKTEDCTCTLHKGIQPATECLVSSKTLKP